MILRIPEYQVRPVTKGMLGILPHDKEEYGRAAQKILEHYAAGDSPAKAVRTSFTDVKMKAGLRSLIREQSSKVWLLADGPSPDQLMAELGQPQKHVYETLELSFAHPSWRGPLQEYLDERDIVIEPFLERRRAYPQLSAREFYEQAVCFSYAMMEYGGRLQIAKLQSEFEQAAAEAVETLSVREPKTLEYIQQEQQQQGVLKCDFPDAYIEWLEKEAGR